MMFVLKKNNHYHLKYGSSNLIYSNTGILKKWHQLNGATAVTAFYFTHGFSYASYKTLRINK